MSSHIHIEITLKEKTRAELYRHIDADYYGYRDEEDGTLLEFENEQESIGTGLGTLGRLLKLRARTKD